MPYLGNLFITLHSFISTSSHRKKQITVRLFASLMLKNTRRPNKNSSSKEILLTFNQHGFLKCLRPLGPLLESAGPHKNHNSSEDIHANDRL